MRLVQAVSLLILVILLSGCSGHVWPNKEPVPGGSTGSPRVSNRSHASPFLRHRTDPAVFFVRFANGLPAGSVTIYCEDEAERLITILTSEGGFQATKLVSSLTEEGEILPPVLAWCRVIKPDGSIALLRSPAVRRSDTGDGWRVVLKLVNATKLPTALLTAPEEIPMDWPDTEGIPPAERSSTREAAPQTEFLTISRTERGEVCWNELGRKYHHAACRFVRDSPARICGSPASSRRLRGKCLKEEY